MNEDLIGALAQILEATLGSMPAKQADEVVEGVVKILKSFHNQQLNGKTDHKPN